jgi:hypothetical protein
MLGWALLNHAPYFFLSPPVTTLLIPSGRPVTLGWVLVINESCQLGEGSKRSSEQKISSELSEGGKKDGE